MEEPLFNCFVCNQRSISSYKPLLETVYFVYSISKDLLSNFPLESFTTCSSCSNEFSKVESHLAKIEKIKDNLKALIHQTALSVRDHRGLSVSCCISETLRNARENESLLQRLRGNSDSYHFMNSLGNFGSHSEIQKPESASLLLTTDCNNKEIDLSNELPLHCLIDEEMKDLDSVRDKSRSQMFSETNTGLAPSNSQYYYGMNTHLHQGNEGPDFKMSDKSKSKRKSKLRNETEKPQVPRVRNDYSGKRAEREEKMKKWNASDWPIKCEICDKGFKTNYLLATHRAAVHEHKFMCFICNKSFSSQQYKEIHMNAIHLKKRKFTCEYCEFITYNKYHLADHIKNYHELSEAEKTCNICFRVFSQMNSMLRHRVLMHPELNSNSSDSKLK